MRFQRTFGTAHTKGGGADSWSRRSVAQVFNDFDVSDEHRQTAVKLLPAAGALR
jgi:hypothetical protein